MIAEHSRAGAQRVKEGGSRSSLKPRFTDPVLRLIRLPKYTSYHDSATLRELLDLSPAPEFARWLEGLEIMKDEKLSVNAGDASIFLRDPAEA